MPIDQRRFINITSGVAAGSAVPRREFILRLFTTNEKVPTGGILDFNSVENVIDFFGGDSGEAMRATQYFGFVSKQVSSPGSISFSRWSETDSAPLIFGEPVEAALNDFTAISDGSLVIEIGGVVLSLEGLDLTTETSFSGVASVIQTAIQTGTGAVFTGSTVVYDAIRREFNFVGGEAGVNAISVSEGVSGSDISAILGWRGLTTVLSGGSIAESPLDAFVASTQLSNNFGSFAFIEGLSIEQIEEVARFNDTQNVLYQYNVPVIEADATAYNQALIGFSGTNVTLAGNADEFHELLPSAILASTDYSRPNASQNYMFQSDAALSPTVSEDATANALDALRVNYYGETQTAGQNRSFYQRGYLMGSNSDPLDIGVYANEQWLKDSIGSEVLSLIEGLGRVSANATGRAQVLGAIQNVITGNSDAGTAIVNGVISAGRTLSNTEQAAVTQLSGDPTAYLQVESIGYWLDADVRSEINNGINEFFIDYTLIYARDTVIRSVEGRNILV